MHKDGWEMKIKCQPPNSPDMNVLDLGFFAAIQGMQQKIRSNSIEELIKATESAYDSQSSASLNNVWLSLQMAMESTMGDQGGNSYRLGHIGKQKLLREGKLQENIVCNVQLITECQNLLTSEVDSHTSEVDSVTSDSDSDNTAVAAV